MSEDNESKESVEIYIIEQTMLGGKHVRRGHRQHVSKTKSAVLISGKKAVVYKKGESEQLYPKEESKKAKDPKATKE